MSAESMVTQAKKRFHVEGQTSTLGARWQIWDGEAHCARFKNIADEFDAHEICATLNERHRTAAQPEREAVLEERHDGREFQEGDKVHKASGYRWPGEVVAVFKTRAGKTRVVVECTVPEVAGALHIYSPEQLELEIREKDEIAEAFARQSAIAELCEGLRRLLRADIGDPDELIDAESAARALLSKHSPDAPGDAGTRAIEPSDGAGK